MKLWEINVEIDRILNRVEWDIDAGAFVDPDTGEIMTSEELDAELDRLDMNRDEILQYLAKKVLNIRAEIAGLKPEITRLQEMKKKREKKEERLLAIIDRECKGENKDLGVASFNYRMSHPLEYDPGAVPDIIAWLEENNHDDCLKYAEPEIKKEEIKKLIKAGENVPYCSIADKRNGSLK
jgi:hypothetical protein